MKGGSRGLCYADDWDGPDGPILVPEGPSDWATLVAMGLAAVGRPSSTGGVDHLAALLQDVPADRPIIIVGENDEKPGGRCPGREGAVATAEGLARRLNRPISYALPPEGMKDVRDWFKDQGPALEEPASLRKLGRSLVAALQRNAREIVPWEPILAIDDPEQPTFPTEALAVWQRQYVEALAVATQTPVDLAAMLVLAVAAVALARRAVVCVREGYEEPLNLFTMVAQPPASRKTSVFRDVTSPVEEYERELATQARPVVSEARTLAEIDRKILEELQRKASKAQEEAERTTLTEQARNLALDLASRGMPEVPRLLTDDSTQEALGRLMAIHGNRIGVLSPEGGVFEIMNGRYTNGKTQPNLEIYLKSHAGDDVRVDRMNRPPEFLRRPALTIGLAVQPDVLGRFLYALPKSLVGHREVNPEPVPVAIRGEYREKVRALLTTQAVTDAEGDRTEHVIGLSAEAYALWLDFASWIEPQLGDFGPLAHISDWAGKLAGAVARIVGLLHLADLAGHQAPWSVPVPSATMARAIAIGRYLIPHARAAFAEMGADPNQSDAKYLLEWIRRDGADGFTRRDAFEATKGHFRQVESMEPALELLQRHSYIRRRTSAARTGPGRPTGPAYNVNPAALLGPGRSRTPMAVVSQGSDAPAGLFPDRTGLDDGFAREDTGAGLSAADDLAEPTPLELLIQGDDSTADQWTDGADDYEEGVI
jgi:replicative DNA helicase